MLPENKVANSVAWQSISHGVSPKGVFGLFRVMEFFWKRFLACLGLAGGN